MLRMGTRLPAVDAYIEKTQPFAQPILTHIRETMHKAVPGVDEAMKWSMPFFTYKGVILANIAGFKQHCSFGLWNENAEAIRKETGAEQRGQTMGSFGKLTTVKDLPTDAKLRKLIQEAAAKIEDGTRTKAWAGRAKKDRPAADVPPVLAAALKKHKAAATHFEAFSPSARREYCEWIAEAKSDATRDKRLAQAIEWMAEGKQRNWKYQKKA